MGAATHLPSPARSVRSPGCSTDASACSMRSERTPCLQAFWIGRPSNRRKPMGARRRGGRSKQLVLDPDTAKSVIISGPTGTGKTFLGLHALNAIINTKRMGCLYLPEHSAVSAWRATHNVSNPAEAARGRAVLAMARRTKVLMIDDFGQYRNATDGALDALEAIVMHRYDAGLPVIVTTNRNMAGLREARGDRVVSRLMGMAGDNVIDLLGEDWRER